MTTEHRTATFNENSRFFTLKNDWPSKPSRLQETLLIFTLGWRLPKAPETRCRCVRCSIGKVIFPQKKGSNGVSAPLTIAFALLAHDFLSRKEHHIILFAKKSILASKARPVTIKATVILLLEASNQNVSFTS